MTDKHDTTALTRRGVMAGAAAAGMAGLVLRPGSAAARQPHPNPMPEELRRVLERNPALPVLGNPQGDVTLTEFFDYNCSFCRVAMADVQRLINEDKSLRVVFREWPVFGEGSMYATKASLASLRQGKYWQMHAALMGMRGRAEEATVLRAAREAGLDIPRLQADMEKREILDQIYETMDLADTMMLTGTPTFIAGHEAAFGKMSLGELRELVAQARSDLL
ncbi:MAG: DsbA family protein [Paracoccus sp. (in: a-proteobacteria)]|nr:DsbA family protein [Paracoccus sp. (in: a-proteobacteria)]